MTKHSKSLGKAKPATTSSTAKKKPISEQAGGGHAPTPVRRFTIGLDLGDRSTAFCVLDGDGAIVAEGKFKTLETVKSDGIQTWIGIGLAVSDDLQQRQECELGI
jgi:hypothetical protein